MSPSYRWLEQSRDPSAPPKFKQLAKAVEAARLSVRPTPCIPHIFVTAFSHLVTLLRSLVLMVVLSSRNPAPLLVHYKPATCTQAVIPSLNNSRKPLSHHHHGRHLPSPTSRNTLTLTRWRFTCESMVGESVPLTLLCRRLGLRSLQRIRWVL